MENDLPSGWIGQLVTVILLYSVGLTLIPTAFFAPAYLWEYWYPPGGPQPLTTPFLSITLPSWGFALLLFILAYQQTKRFIKRTKEWRRE